MKKKAIKGTEGKKINLDPNKLRWIWFSAWDLVLLLCMRGDIGGGRGRGGVKDNCTAASRGAT